MSVNIWVTAPHDGQKILLAWGEHLHAAVDADGDNIITNFSESTVITVRETPAEIMSLVAAEERKQARERIAAMALQGYLANPNFSRWLPDEIAGQAAQSAYALLAALDAMDGAA